MGSFVASVGVLCAVVWRFYPDRVSLPFLRGNYVEGGEC